MQTYILLYYVIHVILTNVDPAVLNVTYMYYT